MTRHCFIAGLIVAAFALASCSRPLEEEMQLPEELRNTPIQIDVFSARAFLGGSDYERYYLTGNVLWRECGHVSATEQPPAGAQKELEGDRVFPNDPSLTIVQRRVEKLTPEQLVRLKVKSAELFKMHALSDVKEPLPGSMFSLSEPGMVEIRITFGPTKFNLLTSVDGVADKDTPVLEHANILLAYLRGLGPVVCESETFSGIPRNEK